MAKTKTDTPRRPRAETPRGFRDYFGQEVVARDEMLARITEVYRRYGFDPLESAAVETLKALGKYLPDVDRPHDGVFAWEDADEGWLALRYDLTAPLARVFAQHRRDLPNPYRRYAVGPVWRNEKPGPGRFRQFYQCDADTVGAASVAADAEMCAMLGEALEAAGIARGDYVIRLNNRKVLDGVLDRVFGWDDSSEDAQLRAVYHREHKKDDVLRAIDKFDKFGPNGVRELLTTGRRDASGVFAPGCGLTDGQADTVIEFLLAKGSSNAATLSGLRTIVGATISGQHGVDELKEIVGIADSRGYFDDRLVVDPSVVRGLGYYTGPVYEAELTFAITDDKGRPRQFGSVAGGGRYDDLITRFTGEKVPATGVSIGVDRLLAALAAKGRAGATEPGPIVVTVMDRARMADYLAMAGELRAARLRAEVFLGQGKMPKQLKYADQRASPIAIIEGEDERERGVVQIKDLALGARMAAEIETREAWAAQPAQVEVPRGELVAQVRAMLARTDSGG
jgi:histidyl-tRNA synthetase